MIPTFRLRPSFRDLTRASVNTEHTCASERLFIEATMTQTLTRLAARPRYPIQVSCLQTLISAQHGKLMLRLASQCFDVSRQCKCTFCATKNLAHQRSFMGGLCLRSHLAHEIRHPSRTALSTEHSPVSSFSESYCAGFGLCGLARMASSSAEPRNECLGNGKLQGELLE